MKSLRSLFPSRTKKSTKGDTGVTSTAQFLDTNAPAASGGPAGRNQAYVQDADDTEGDTITVNGDNVTAYGPVSDVGDEEMPDDQSETTLPDTGPHTVDRSDYVCLPKKALFEYHDQNLKSWAYLMSQARASDMPASYVPGRENLPLRGMTGASDDPMRDLKSYANGLGATGDATTNQSQSHPWQTQTSQKQDPSYGYSAAHSMRPNGEPHPAYAPFLRPRDPPATRLPNDPSNPGVGTDLYPPPNRPRSYNNYKLPTCVSVTDSNDPRRNLHTEPPVTGNQSWEQRQAPPETSFPQTAPDTATFQTAPTDQFPAGQSQMRTNIPEPRPASTAAPPGTPIGTTTSMGPATQMGDAMPRATAMPMATAMPTGTAVPSVPKASEFNPQLDHNNLPRYPPAADPNPFAETTNQAPDTQFNQAQGSNTHSGTREHSSFGSQATRPPPMPPSTQTKSGSWGTRPKLDGETFDEERERLIVANQLVETLEMVGLGGENAQAPTQQVLERVITHQFPDRPGPLSFRPEETDTVRQIDYHTDKLLSLHHELAPTDVLDQEETQKLRNNITDLLRSSHLFKPISQMSPHGTERGVGWVDTSLDVFDDLRKAAQQQAVREGRSVGLTSMLRESPLLQQYNDQLTELNEWGLMVEDLTKQTKGTSAQGVRSEADVYQWQMLQQLDHQKETITQQINDIHKRREEIDQWIRPLVERRNFSLTQGWAETARAQGDAINTMASILTGTDLNMASLDTGNLDRQILCAGMNVDRWYDHLNTAARARDEREQTFRSVQAKTDLVLKGLRYDFETLKDMRFEEAARTHRGLSHMDPATVKTLEFLASLGLHKADPAQLLQTLNSMVNSAMSQIASDQTGYTREYLDYLHRRSGGQDRRAPSRERTRYGSNGSYVDGLQNPPAYAPPPKPAFQTQAGTQVRDFARPASFTRETNATTYTQPQGLPVVTEEDVDGGDKTFPGSQEPTRPGGVSFMKEVVQEQLQKERDEQLGAQPGGAPPGYQPEPTVTGGAHTVGFPPEKTEIQSGALPSNAFVWTPRHEGQ